MSYDIFSFHVLSARAASQVTGILGLTSYAGFITVNDFLNSNMYFWFFKAQVHVHVYWYMYTCTCYTYMHAWC